MNICKHNDFCGGCIYQGMDYGQQLRIKEDEVLRLMAEKGVVLAADVWGKAKTVTQTIAIPLVMLYNPIFCLIDVPVDQILLWISTVLCVVSGVRYVRGAWPYIFESR